MIIEPKGKGKAEFACRAGMGVWLKIRNFEGVAQVLERYGNYLLLTGQDQPVGEARTYVR